MRSVGRQRGSSVRMGPIRFKPSHDSGSNMPSTSSTSPEGEADRAVGGVHGEVDETLVRRFVEHWGMMARAWGINASMGEIFALLFVTNRSWTAEDLRVRLKVSRGNVSMNLRELMTWGLIHKVHRQGERREFFRAEEDVWTLFRNILAERKRRELDPTLNMLRQTVGDIPSGEEHRIRRERLSKLADFFSMINGLASRLLLLDAEGLAMLSLLFSQTFDGTERSESQPPEN